MIISWNKKMKKNLYISVCLIILVLAVFMIKGNSGETLNVNVPADQQDNLDVSIEEILSEKEETNYFSEYRMERERIRSKQVETLKDIMNGESSSQEAKDAAALRLVKITEDIEREMKAENLVKSKGYEDCAVIIQAEMTTVVILAAALRVDQEEDIKSMVSRAVQCSEESLCIIAREK